MEMEERKKERENVLAVGKIKEDWHFYILFLAPAGQRKWHFKKTTNGRI